MKGLTGFGDRRPITLQLRDALRELIVEARLAPGDRLPSEAELAAQFGVARQWPRNRRSPGDRRRLERHLKSAGPVEYQDSKEGFRDPAAVLDWTADKLTKMVRAGAFLLDLNR